MRVPSGTSQSDKRLRAKRMLMVYGTVGAPVVLVVKGVLVLRASGRTDKNSDAEARPPADGVGLDGCEGRVRVVLICRRANDD